MIILIGYRVLYNIGLLTLINLHIIRKYLYSYGTCKPTWYLQLNWLTDDLGKREKRGSTNASLECQAHHALQLSLIDQKKTPTILSNVLPTRKYSSNKLNYLFQMEVGRHQVYQESYDWVDKNETNLTR